MPLSIKHPDADRLARELAAETGESITDAVIASIRERLDRHRARHGGNRLARDIARIQARYQRLPIQDARSADELIAYDKNGLPL